MGFELAVDQIRVKILRLGFAGRDRRSTFTFAGYSCQTHQPGSLFTANTDTFAAKGVPHFPYTVDAVVFGMDHTDVLNQGSITQTPRTKSTSFGLTVATRGDEASFAIALQRRTDELDCETIPICINELDHFLTFWAEF
ncbi:hypothetical protein BKD82_07615 [Corynebacterium diphtheriae]|nr:hypothetical protein [Corynebacterium diphtheriae]OFI52468.1 hypothetical protein BKD82_07615 [Corynebacterium diphtheriae]OFI62499.1 hypothetical protein BKD87_06570 [Corynebacterium diphtheriae]